METLYDNTILSVLNYPIIIPYLLEIMKILEIKKQQTHVINLVITAFKKENDTRGH
jgi:hypothetical protein